MTGSVGSAWSLLTSRSSAIARMAANAMHFQQSSFGRANPGWLCTGLPALQIQCISLPIAYQRRFMNRNARPPKQVSDSLRRLKMLWFPKRRLFAN